MNLTRDLAHVLLSSTVVIGVLNGSAQAQVTPASNDANTIVTPSGNTFDITGGATAGANLFHSFQTFGLNADQIANFRANPAVQNILGRVLGGDASVINGLIQVTGSNANLYLMNPAGIVFGANARLDVAGSFTATTANGIGFGAGEASLQETRWLSVIGSNDYANLIGTPNSFAFTMSQPGSIINAGNLAVGTGQSITLLGGTVINTGTLTAPGGNIIVATVAGEKLVRVSQNGSLLNLDLPTETKTAINPSPFTPLSLPELLTGGNLSNATGLTVENGTVKLTGSGVGVASGDVVAKTVRTQTATLAAANNLILMESELSTTGNLSLLAQNTVQIRDSAAKPALIQAGGNLTIQGNQAVAIVALNHADSGLVSGGDMVLRSTQTISGDAHYFAGGSLKFEQLNGSPGNVFSPYDPIILAAGDVTLGDYTGASLHILAGGSVTLGNVIINAPGIAAETINPANTALFNGSRTFASLAPITRADDSPLYVNVRPTVDSAGNVQRIPTAANQLVIDGRNPTLDVRAGIDWNQLGGLPVNRSIPTPLPNSAPSPNQPTFTAPTSANITVNSIEVNGVFGSLTIPEQPGFILLTNQYKPNTALADGTIQVVGTIPTGTPATSIRCIDCSTRNRVVGTLAIDSRSAINLGNIEATFDSTSAQPINFRGDTSNINVDLAAIGNIATGSIIATGLNPGNYAASSVVLRSTTGNIRVSLISASSNGVDINAAGLFQATGVARARFGDIPPVNSSAPGTPLYNFLIAKGVPATAIPFSVVVADDASLYQNSSILLTQGSSVVIQYGDASRTLVNTNTAQRFQRLQVVVRGGDAAFSLGPRVSGSLISSQDPYVVGVFTNGKLQYQPVTAQTVSLNRFSNRSNLYFNHQYAPLVFGSADFAVDASGLVGGIILTGGGDSLLLGSIQNLSFPAILKQPNPVTGGVLPVDPVDRLAALRQQFQGEDGQVAQRQLTTQAKEDACGTATIAAVPSGKRGGGTGDASDRATAGAATSAQSSCNQASDDSQILQLLEEAPGASQNKQLDLDSLPQRAEAAQHSAPTR